MRNLLRIMDICRRQWPWMAAGILLGVAVIAANALMMATAGWFIASMAVAGVTGVPFVYFVPSVALRVLALLRTFGRYGERLVTHEAAFRQLADLRVWLFDRLEPLAPAGLEQYAAGDVAGRLRSDVDSLENLYLRILAPLATGSVSIALAVLWTAGWSGASALILLTGLLLTGLMLPLLTGRMAAVPGREAAELSAQLRIGITEGLQGAEELAILGAGEQHAARINELSCRLTERQSRLSDIAALSTSSGFAISGLTAAALLFAGAISVNQFRLSGPELVMILLFALAAFEAAMTLPAALQQIPAAELSAGRMLELAGATPPVSEPGQPVRLPDSCDLVLDTVTHSYLPGRPAMPPISLTIPAGSRIALTGPSGSGKSTLAELLLRFREYAGSITIGGTELRQMDAGRLRSLITAVPQQPHLFNSSIRENILIGNRDATEEQLAQAVDDAGLAGWIAGLPQGLDTPVGEGGSAVSGGEGRRIALARALLKEAPILLLDEPTEGLDAVTERHVVERLNQRSSGKTLIIISHRPACLALAEQVVSFHSPLAGEGQGDGELA